MTRYEHSLHAMEHLLTNVGEEHWAKWIGEDIEQWKTAGDVSHHLSAYGGMGSFNDVLICRANLHNVTDAQEPWAGALFEWLKSVCYYLAKLPNEQITADSLKKAVGRFDSSLAAFVGGDKSPASMRGYSDKPQKIQGWRCLNCGHSEISHRAIDCFIARDLIPDLVFRACENNTLIELVDQILALEIPALDATHRLIAAAATSSDIMMHDRDGGMRPCPKCKGDDTAVYRWQLDFKQLPRLAPSDDNLPLRK